jgi:NADPH:quinone reductase-like Zn-dependent oxidoreductase
MGALRFHKTGDFAGLQVEQVPTPSPGPGELLVRVRAAAINPSDVKNVQGKMHQTTVPRTPGLWTAHIILDPGGARPCRRFYRSGRPRNSGQSGSPWK